MSYSSYESTIVNLEVTVESLQNTVIEHEETIKRLQNEIEIWKNNCNNNIRSINYLTNSNNHLREQNQLVEGRLIKLGIENQKLEKDIRQSAFDAHYATERFQTAETRVFELLREIDTLKAENEKFKKGNNLEIPELPPSNVNEYDEIPDLCRTLENLNPWGHWEYFHKNENNKWVYSPKWVVDEDEDDLERLHEVRQIWDNILKEEKDTPMNERTPEWFENIQGRKLSTHTELIHYESKFGV